MRVYRSDYGTIHAFYKLLTNLRALPAFFKLKFTKDANSKVDSKLVFIISFPRSGTHALASTINHSGSGLHYYGEFFIFNQWSKIVEDLNRYIPFFSWRYFLNTRRQKRKWIHFRFEKTSLDPVVTLHKMLNFTGTHIIKIFPEHLKVETLENLIKEFKPHIIFLRRNHLDRYVSLKKAYTSGKWHKVDSSSFDIEVNESELAKYIVNYDNFYRDVLSAAKSNGCQILDLDFRDLHDPEKILEIQSFVSLSGGSVVDTLPKHPTTTKMDKTSSSQEKFLNRVGKQISDFDFVRLQ